MCICENTVNGILSSDLDLESKPSNIFAILGLRSIYFLLAGSIDKFYYLNPGLAAILLFIGTKMLLSHLYEIPIATSIAVIFGILGLIILLSFVRIRYVLIKGGRSRPEA